MTNIGRAVKQIKTKTNARAENLCPCWIGKIAMGIKEYLTGRVPYYVDDCFCCDKNDIEYLFFLESPHNDEIDSNVPLVGSSGIAVSKFLFGDEQVTSFGLLVSEQKSQYKIGIINISNVPLQYCKSIPESQFPEDLKKLRSSAGVNEILYNIFKEKMDLYHFPQLKKIIVCGEFASMYFDKYNDCKKEPWPKENILYVPHPSRGQWAFIENHKDNLQKLKDIFPKKKE